MKLNAKLLLDQRQTLSQSQIQFLEILSMDNIELATFLQKEYLENPILECYSGTEGSYTTDDILESAAAVDVNQIQDYLLGQLKLSEYTAVEQKVLYYLTNCLEDSGLFVMPIEEVAKALQVKEEIIATCLQDLQQLEPYGVFAPDLPHCLIRQLEVQGIHDGFLEEIILKYLSEVAAGNIGAISRGLGLTTLQVKKYLSVIKSLNPKPLSGFSNEISTYLVPDLILQKTSGTWEVLLNDHWIGDYGLSSYYLELMNTTRDAQLIDFFKAKAQRASFLMKCIEQRRSTLLRLGEILLNYQLDYFEERAPLKPMTMAEIGDQLKVHGSTVSRCAKGKYLQYPKGTVLIKDLFSASEASPVKALLTELISGENPHTPYTDQTLLQLLKEKNFSLSRRVIAKYREELGIKSSYERKISS